MGHHSWASPSALAVGELSSGRGVLSLSSGESSFCFRKCTLCLRPSPLLHRTMLSVVDTWQPPNRRVENMHFGTSS